MPEDGLNLLGMSYDNTGGLGATTWRHVAFIEQIAPGQPTGRSAQARAARAGRTAALADVQRRVQALHRSGLPGRVPDRRADADRVRHRRGPGRHLQRLRLLRAGLPVRRDRPQRDRRRAPTSARCATTGWARHEPACAKACPTESIQFGPLDELRERARARVDDLHEAGRPEARLYREGPDNGIGGAGAFFLLLDEPEVYGLPPDPVVSTRELPGHVEARGWPRPAWLRPPGRVRRAAAVTGEDGRRRGGACGPRRRTDDGAEGRVRSYYGRPIIKEPVWEVPDVPGYLFFGGLAGASSVLAAGAQLTGRPGLARAAKLARSAAIGLSTVS